MEGHSTRWSLLASGEGANRIALLYYSKFRNPAIEDRVLLLNTTTADVKPAKTFEYMLAQDERFKETFERIKREKICIFGKSPSGAGNSWKVGENEAFEDFDLIRRYIDNLRLGRRDVMLGVSTLGGGTGNGSLPYVIHRLKSGDDFGSMRNNSYLALGILPYDFEPSQRYFNTICGLTRFLKYGEKGSQNADILILTDNSQIERIRGMAESKKEERYHWINQAIIKAIEMLIAPGGTNAKSVIDVADYYQLPSNIGGYHFTPCLSLNNDPEIMELETVLETALGGAMLDVEPKTATMAYIIVVAPKKYVEDGTFTQEGLEDISLEWAIKNLAGNRGGILRYCSLVASEDTDTLDVMILLGGFSLDRLISKSLQKYHDFKESLRHDKDEVEIQDVEDPRIKVRVNMADIELIEQRLKDYVALTEERIKSAKKGKIDLEKELRGWGFKK